MDVIFTVTNKNAVRWAVATVAAYYANDYSGVIIQNVNTSATMLSTTGFSDRSEMLGLTDTQYNALMNNGVPNTAFVDYMKSKVTQGVRGIVLGFERDRIESQLSATTWGAT